MGLLRAAIGNSAHLWMWDAPAMTKALQDAGFVNVRVCRMGDATDPCFAEVEREGGFHDGAEQVDECALEGMKPH
jgi:hypothetical protein